MTVSTVRDVAVADRGDDGTRHQLLLGPDDGYGDVSLERFSVPAAARPWPVPDRDGDRLVVVLAGCARVAREHDAFCVTLGPDEVVHLDGALRHTVEVVSAGTAGALELLVVSRRPGAR